MHLVVALDAASLYQTHPVMEAMEVVKFLVHSAEVVLLVQILVALLGAGGDAPVLPVHLGSAVVPAAPAFQEQNEVSPESAVVLAAPVPHARQVCSVFLLSPFVHAKLPSAAVPVHAEVPAFHAQPD